ncbi:hypothetical protein FP744_10008345 [Trichoderma asperellum]|nr:hypothetical protein LI328DRAFT_145194 [Trichoderma asperelloides]
MDFASDDNRGIATAFGSQFSNQCAIVIEQLESGVCVCPTGTPIISGGSWATASRKRDDDESCEETMEANVIGWSENGSTWTVHKDDDATYTNIVQAIANGTSKSDIGKFIKEHGQKA